MGVLLLAIACEIRYDELPCGLQNLLLSSWCGTTRTCPLMKVLVAGMSRCREVHGGSVCLIIGLQSCGLLQHMIRVVSSVWRLALSLSSRQPSLLSKAPQGVSHEVPVVLMVCL